MDIPIVLDLPNLTLSDSGSDTGCDHGDDTDENPDSGGSADQDQESISDEELNRRFQEDMEVEHEHVYSIDFHTMHDPIFKEEHSVRERKQFCL